MKTLLLHIGAALFCASSFAQTKAQTEEFWTWGKARELPAGCKVSLICDHTSYFLGENILLHYRIENAGSQTFQISVGGDYRGGTRADRFKVSAVSADGKPVADPTPLMRNFGGGLMPNGEIGPGKEWFERVFLIEYCRFDQPGTFTVLAFHDLGFGPQRENDSRVVKLTIELRAPTEDESRKILTEDDSKPDSRVTWGKKGEARLDYKCIRWPTFLKPLAERAQQGSEAAVEGIGSIRSLDASRTLTNMLDHSNTALAAKAAQLLEVRLPHPASDFTGPWGDQRRPFIIENAWEDALSPTVRSYCLRLLQGTNRDELMRAASLLRLIGTPQEVPALQRAVEVALTQTTPEYQAEIRFPAPIRAADSLLGAALALQPDLDIAPKGELTSGETLLFLARHGGRDQSLTADKQAIFARALKHPLAYLRMKALDQLPKEIPESLADPLSKCLTDENTGVQTYAFEAARRMQVPQHRDIALAVLKTASDDWLLRAASAIAQKYGARYDCALIFASRLVTPKDQNDYFPHELMRELFAIIVGDNTGADLKVPRDAEAAKTMIARWTGFLQSNKQKVSAGGLFKIEELPLDLGINSSLTKGISVSK